MKKYWNNGYNQTSQINTHTNLMSSISYGKKGQRVGELCHIPGDLAADMPRLPH